MTDQKPTGSPLWMRILLVVSLGLNLLVIGAVAGAVITRDRPGGPADRVRTARDIAPPAFVMALEAEDRRALVTAFRGAAPDGRPNRKAMRQTLNALLQELRSEEFDPETVHSLLASQRNAALSRQTAGAEVFVAHIAGMSAEDRRAYADRLERLLRKGPKR